MSEEHRLRYTTPSTGFPTSLPLGNGRLAASVLSSASHESFILNEVTFWSGAPHVAGSGLATRPADPKAELRETQRCFLAGDFAQGKKRSEKYLESQKHNFGTNLGVGRLDIAVVGHEDAEQITEFTRELRLDDAVAETSYKFGANTLRRRCFVSHPHEVLVVHFESSGSGGVEIVISLQGENDAFTSQIRDGRLEFDAHALETIHSDGKSGVRGYGMVTAIPDRGKVQEKDGKLVAKGSEMTVLLAFNTDYQRADRAWREQATLQLDAASKVPVADLLAAHIADYQPLYQRTTLSLGSGTDLATNLTTTDQRRAAFEPSHYADPAMFALYFQYARYLTIAGTRANSPLPLHLQGLWNDGEACRMGWSCDYHLDVNTQMNYFATLASGLSDLMQPMVSYLQSLVTAGHEAARACYGCDGWVAHVFTNVWGFADPGWETTYGLNVTGGLWMATHLIEMYEYTLDEAFLAESAYPILKSAAQFFLEYMIEDPETGWLLTGPAVSPENSFFVSREGGQKEEHYLSLAPTLDVVLLRDLFAFCVHATKRLGIDAEFSERVQSAQAKLPPLQIGRTGQLQEWLRDYEEAQPFHRHLSHTMALCRSAQVSVRHQPELAKAAGVSLERRQGRDDLEDIEFTAALFALNYARLNDADKAVAQVGHLVGELSFDNLLSYSKPGVAGAEKNIFVVDGNFGGAAAIVEMLARSLMPDLGGPVEVDLLPALPTNWLEGKVAGLRLRGNMELDMEWSAGKLVKATLKPSSAGTVVVYYGTHRVETSYSAGQPVELGPTLQATQVGN